MSFLNKCEKNVSLKNYCTIKVGGNAKYLYIANSKNDLLNACIFCNNKNIKFKIVGFGANLIFSDKGFDGMIIVNRLNSLIFRKTHAYAESGVSMSSLINKCFLKGLSNLEKLSGIPSTIGGATVNNLGAFDCSFGDFIEYVECYKKENPNKKITLKNSDCKFGYRTSAFKNNDYIITKVKINLQKAEKSLIKQQIVETINKKTNSQPLDLPSAGSIFKRSSIIPAKVIDELGLKGLIVGKAQISKKHAGFIVNLGGATAQDIKGLIAIIKYKLGESLSKNLETEIEFVE